MSILAVMRFTIVILALLVIGTGFLWWHFWLWRRKPDSDRVFDKLVEVLMSDNGGWFSILPEDRAAALPHIEALIAAGFFRDDPNDFDGSYWQAAAGEYTEVRQYFSGFLEHYLALEAVLNTIFERPVNEVPAR